MQTFFGILFFLNLLALIIGLVSPKSVIKWGSKRTRGRVFLTYGLPMVVFLNLTSVTGPPIEQEKEGPIVSPASTVKQESPVTGPKAEEHKPSPAKEPKLAPATIWHEIARWQGKGIKNTETFHIPSREWRISWSTKPGEYGDMNFQIFVYKSDGSLVTVAANVIGKDKDSSFMRGAGDYYLTINTGQPYLVIVEAKY